VYELMVDGELIHGCNPLNSQVVMCACMYLFLKKDATINREGEGRPSIMETNPCL
jgi:hypothetical protein